MTNQQLKDKIQAALEAVRTGGPAGNLGEIIAGLSRRSPSGAHHAAEIAVVTRPSRPTYLYRISAQGLRVFPKRYDLFLTLIIEVLAERCRSCSMYDRSPSRRIPRRRGAHHPHRPGALGGGRRGEGEQAAERGEQNARVDRGSHHRDFLLDTLEDGRPTLADWKPRSFAHARQRHTRNGLTALLLLSTYIEHRFTVSHWLHF
jgi:hypothetical protein